jgi:hypothetical protein
MAGQIRVGRRIYGKNGAFTDPSFPGFEDILCLTKSTEYGSLGPYVLTDDKGHIMENIWQFAKIYKRISPSRQTYSRYDQRIIWDHPAEVHMINGVPTTEYKLWRQKGMECVYPIRYPVGFTDRGSCIGSIKSSEYNKCVHDETYVPKLLTYVEARKEIYLKTYLKLIKKAPDFKKLLKAGKNLLIIEVDGPHEEALEYYKTKYNVGDDFITENTILASQENMDIMLNDEKFPFGHGYCLAIALNQELNQPSD